MVMWTFPRPRDEEQKRMGVFQSQKEQAYETQLGILTEL